MNNWKRYKNGNYVVSINLEDGTKIRENNLDYFEAAFPESADICISQRCDNGCAFCYANCTPDGKKGDLNAKFFDTLHPWTEIAINLNDVTDSDLVPFLERMKAQNIIVNGTINQRHFMKHMDTVKMLVDKELIFGLGISLVDPNADFISTVKQFKNAVIHVINGLITTANLRKLSNHGLKVLFLGYKDVGRGVNYKQDENILAKIHAYQTTMYYFIEYVIRDKWFDVIAFDNLAISQLEPQRFMGKEEWNGMFMGDDGADGKLTSASMYIDVVNNTFSVNSCSDEKFPIMDNIDDMYQFLIKKYNGD